MRLVLALALMLAAAPARAALIYLDFAAPGDELIILDTNTGIEWLRGSATAGLSYNAIQAGGGGLLAAGWYYATLSDLCGLVNAPGANYCPGGFGYTYRPGPGEPPSPEGASSIGLATGFLRTYESGSTNYGFFGWGYSKSRGILRDASVHVGINYAWDDTGGGDYTTYRIDYNSGGGDPTRTDYGQILIRGVPEPGTAALVALGVASLPVVGRRARA